MNYYLGNSCLIISSVGISQSLVRTLLIVMVLCTVVGHRWGPPCYLYSSPNVESAACDLHCTWSWPVWLGCTNDDNNDGATNLFSVNSLLYNIMWLICLGFLIIENLIVSWSVAESATKWGRLTSVNSGSEEGWTLYLTLPWISNLPVAGFAPTPPPKFAFPY